jgi:hypothetical protein
MRSHPPIIRFPPKSRAHYTIGVDSITHTTVGFDQRSPRCLIAAVGMGGYFRLGSGLRPTAFRISIINGGFPRMGMSATMRPFYLKILSCMMVMVLPTALLAADLPGAMLYSHGTALLNGNTIARSSAIFSGDLVQTNADSVANINATGSSVLVMNDSLVQYEGSALKLEHGGVTISTSKLLAASAGAVKVTPAAGVWTEFSVRDVDGRVQIAARKGDLTISDDTGTSTLAEGQETTRDDSQSQSRNKKRKKGIAEAAAPGAAGAIFDSPITIGIAGAIAAGGTIWVLSRNDDALSPAKPQ